jgi:5-methylcytosine-specific restriction enzyme A
MKKPLKPCAEPGCSKLTRDSHCAKHKPEHTTYNPEYETTNQRVEDKKFYNSKRWRKFRMYVANSKPMICAECQKAGRIRIGGQLDHIKPRKDYPELAFDEDNMQWLCREHHNAKRAEE